MGVVDEATDARLGRKVVLKMLNGSSTGWTATEKPSGTDPLWKADGKEIFYRNGF